MRKAQVVGLLALTLAGSAAAAQQPQPGPAAIEGPRTLAKDTRIIVKTQDQISSQASKRGDIIKGAVKDNVKDSSGAVVIPQGSQAELEVIGTSAGLALSLRSVTAAGQGHSLKTARASTTEGPKGPSTEWNVFDSNSLGLGRVSGVNKPAVGVDFVIPPGSEVTFRLAEAMPLTPK